MNFRAIPVLALGLSLSLLACKESTATGAPSGSAASTAGPGAKGATEAAPADDCAKVTKCCEAIQKSNLAPGVLKGCQGSTSGASCKKYIDFVSGPIKTSKASEYASMPAECHW